MHYKNGRQANVGDPVVGKAYNTKGPIVGRMVSITEGSASCNCTVAFVGDAAQPVKTDYSRCDNFYHAEDALALSDAAYTKPAPAPAVVEQERPDTNFPGYAEKMSAAHAPLPLNWPDKT